MKTTVRVICQSGNSWVTGINTDLAGARKYFLGQTFVTNEDEFTGEETKDLVIQVDEVQS